MRYTPLSEQFYKDTRAKLAKKLKPSSLAVFNSNDVQPTNADGHLKFRQNNDLFYLCGIDQEETILVLFPEARNPKHREILFLRKTSELIEIWEGHKFTKEEGKALSGIETVYWTEQFEAVFAQLAFEAEFIYLNSNEHARNSNEVQTRDARFTIWCKEKYPLHTYQRSAPLLQDLRMIKTKEEIDQLKKAGAITEKAYDRVLKMLAPEVLEYEVEAEITDTFLKAGSRGHAYEPIIASGGSACVLHYIDNDKACKDGELVLMDFGAEYGNYNADLTRTVPVNGKFSPRQKEVYNAVLEVYRVAKAQLRAGNTFEAYDKAVAKAMEAQLIQLGLLKSDEVAAQNPEQPLYRKYFMHGVSHFLGLDVHDVGHKHDPIAVGMVLTIEPGIYIREEGIGVRIENDILITEEGNEELMPNVATTVEEIETAMGRV